MDISAAIAVWEGSLSCAAHSAGLSSSRTLHALSAGWWKEFDSLYDATANVVSTADARKALFEELLWEHRSLAEAHSKCQAIPEASIEALKAQIATLQ
ncbi:hypothetical protein QYE76_037653, partial [Lolium multiflorum]